MSTVTCDLAITLDGYAAGPAQTLERPFGEIDTNTLHAWHLEHRARHQAEHDAIVGADAYVMGRNMFAPRGDGPWPDDWIGWWGTEPPYRAPVYVLTHHPHAPITLDGGTTFHFVTDGPTLALALARETAGSDGRVAVAGGVTTVNQYLAAGEIDELRLHVVPFTAALGSGPRLFDGVGPIDWHATTGRWTPDVTHLVYRRGAAPAD
ncbi:bifunctional deaminase-reductase domain protein [Xylanimonas cellulosilytica DSM 15894]|uniref:Bifunctional deaminase-reductase domain protein n=1 Tax=Xylanimonas cellulosilytica (strain DSM 15894 / JCM 12276 / CECT 5975 / KCTC 9989 / LMG 20990 / NBRC 107835 / XIL07) TaxID=446471 RepID=D1BT53_XYLCX|nr:dihydrofolate reductase family protein [Xylanimonas cellulosilytica]ACZ30895.1 bifunctional deaminase-reductase domain protein [Xylanimonas cellulosilytica DSM 15894]